MLTDLAPMKTMMDADMPFILQLETMIVDKLRDPVTQMMQQGLLPPGQGPPQQGGPPPQSPTQLGGLQQSPNMPNADELRRFIGQANG